MTKIEKDLRMIDKLVFVNPLSLSEYENYFENSLKAKSKIRELMNGQDKIVFEVDKGILEEEQERAFKEGRDTSVHHRDFYRHGTFSIPVPASRICKPDSPDDRRGEHVLRDASDRVYSRGNPV